ncbi:MAG: cytochrome c oxidase subunit II [Myxococcota bacterium]
MMREFLTGGLVHGLLGQAQGSLWMPPEASTFANDMDPLFYFVLYLSTFFFVLLMGATVWFTLKYRERSPDQKTSPVKHNGRLEFLWSAIPTVLLVVIFAWGQKGFVALSTAPSDALDLRVTGQKWNWTIDYPGLNKSCSPTSVADPVTGIERMETDFFVPANRPVKLTIGATDVLHSFYIPAFRLKRDAVPGRYTGYWFNANEPGVYDMYCAEYCGQQHSEMRGRVHVLTDMEWRAFLKSGRCPALDPDADDYGEKLYQANCKTCHSIDGSRLTGPSFKGIWGKSEKMADGSSVTVDDNYIRESLRNPNAKIVEGYAPGMSVFDSGKLDDRAVNALIDYIKSLGGDDTK